MRRLTRREYNNTIRDLLGDASAPAANWLADPEGASFDNNAGVQVVTRQHVEQFTNTAADVAARAIGSLASLAPCDESLESVATCAEAFIGSFGGRVYRRPLAPDEIQALHNVYAYGFEQGGYSVGIRYVIETALQAPQFLYRPELGESPASGTPTRVRLTPWEIASRLSYFFWGSLPDQGLFQAARENGLETIEQVRAQAKRLLADPRATETVQSFYEQWLRFSGLSQQKRSTTAYPEFTDTVAVSMKAGVRAFLADVTLGSGQGKFQDLMTARYAFADENTAPLLGVTLPAGSGLRRVELPETERAGILTDLAVLTAHSSYAGYSPIARGVYLRENIMCDPLPAPPQNVTRQVSEPTLGQTTRERFAEHRSDPSCAGCHALIDGIGFGFEHYDAIGRYRAEEGGKAIDARGEVVGYPEIAGEYDGAVALAEKLAKSSTAKACFMKQWFRFASGRNESAADQCLLDDLYQRFESGQFRIRDLLLAIAESDAFLYRQPVQTEGCTQ